MTTGNRKPVTIWAPPGRLGLKIVAGNGETKGHVWVGSVEDTSPLKDQIQVGDWLVRIDNTNVQGKSVDEISKQLHEKSTEALRILRVLRGIRRTKQLPQTRRGLTILTDENSDNALPNLYTADDEESSSSSNTSTPSPSRIRYEIALPSVPLYGFSVGDAAPDSKYYVWVSKIDASSPLAGFLFPGDWITHMDGHPVRSCEALINRLLRASMQEGASITLTVLRDMTTPKTLPPESPEKRPVLKQLLTGAVHHPKTAMKNSLNAIVRRRKAREAKS